MLFTTSDCVKTPLDFVRLWLHEASRVYGDKLIEKKDMETFTKLKFDIAKQFFEVYYYVHQSTHSSTTIYRFRSLNATMSMSSLYYMQIFILLLINGRNAMAVHSQDILSIYLFFSSSLRKLMMEH